MIAIGLMNRFQYPALKVALTPFVQLSSRHYLFGVGIQTQAIRIQIQDYERQLEWQVGFEIEPMPNASIMFSLVRAINDEAPPGILLSCTFR